MMTTTETTTAPQDTEELTAEQAEALVREYADLQAEVAPMQERMDDIKTTLRGLGQGSHEVAGLKVTIARNARLDSKKAQELYPAEKYPEIYKTSLDSTALKRMVAPAVYDAMSTEGEPRVTIK